MSAQGAIGGSQSAVGDSRVGEAAARAKTSVIIVNWNSAALLGECLRSVIGNGFQAGVVREVIVVDNASHDRSLSIAHQLAEAHPIRIVSNDRNRGFAAACNQAASIAHGEYLLFLNPDCRLMPGALEAACRVLNAAPSIGVVGVALESDDGQVSRSCYRFPNLCNFLYRITGLSFLSQRFPDGSMRDWAHDCDRTVDHVIGAFYVVRAQEFRAIGGFDERFFVYLEDLDLSLRYRHGGQVCMFLASARSYHKGGGTSTRARAHRLFYATRSRILYAFKHFSAPEGWVHCAATVVIEPLARLFLLIAQARFAEVGEVLRGFAMVYRDLPSMLRTARRK